jgi:hypothetical protein
MIDLVKLADKTNRVMNNIFLESGINNISLYVYKHHDFPFLKTICDTFEESMNKNQTTKKIKSLNYLKTYDKKSTLVVFCLLLNNNNINDINYQFNDLSNLVKTNYKVDCLQIFINCQFSEYHEYVNAINNQIKSYITKKYENKINNEDGLQ